MTAIQWRTGSYHRHSAKLRQQWTANPATVCAYCHKPARPGDPWEADHQRPGDPTSPLRAAHQSCNRSAGATLGNKRRIKLTTTTDW